MPQQGPLQWLDGVGWLVAVGGGRVAQGETDAIVSQVLSLINLDRPMVTLLSEGARAEAYAVLEHYTELGGPGGEAFSLAAMSRQQLNSPRFLTLLEEAGLLYLGGGNPLPLVRNLYGTRALERILEGFSTLQGLTIVANAGSVAVLGRWAIGPAPEYLQAKAWGLLMNAVIEPHFTRTEDSVVLRNINQLGSGILGLGIPNRTALAFGPEGQVETWGDAQVTAVVSTHTA